jgi:Aspartyl protease
MMIVTTLLLATLVNQLVPERRIRDGHAAATSHIVPLVCDAQNAMSVPVSVESTPARPFLLDTGASLTTIDERAATRLALADAGRIASPVGSDPLVTAQLTVGSAVLAAGRVVTADFRRLRELLGAVDGILGSDALRAMGRATIDYDRCLLVAGGTIGPLPPGAVRVPLEFHEGRPVVVIGGGGRLVLDSGAASVTIFSGTRAAAILRWSGGAPSPVRVDRFDGVSSGLLGRLACLAIGSMELRDEPAVAVRSWYAEGDANAPDGLLPLALFSRVQLDFDEGYVVLHPRPAPPVVRPTGSR